MWFRSGFLIPESEGVRVSDFKSRPRGQKVSTKSASLESEDATVRSHCQNEKEELSSQCDSRSMPSLNSDEFVPKGPKRKQSRSLNSDQDKSFLVDRKYKNNRIVKSTSKTKIINGITIDKKDGIKQSRSSSRKISAPSVIRTPRATNPTESNKTRSYGIHPNLNLNALYKFVSNSTSNKKLTVEEFDKIRTKSLSEAASAAAAPIVSLPIYQSHHIENDNINSDKNMHTPVHINHAGFKGNKNTNNFSALKQSSPSLTSRVTAKINETANNFKNRKPKSARRKNNSRRHDVYRQISIDRPNAASVVRHPSDRRPDLNNICNNAGATQNVNELGTSQSLDADTSTFDSAEQESKKGERPKSKSAPVSVNRSESYKERLSHKRNRNRRKTSDPSLSKTNDEQSESGLSNSNFTRSSSSSLSSSSLESPSTSLEQVSGPSVSAVYNASANVANTSAPRHWVDSDEEIDITDVCWTSNISAEVLAVLSDAEKERQQVINELYETERNHVRTLKLLEGMFMRPLQESGVLPQENLQLLFPPALLSLKDLHGSFEQKLKQRRIDHGYLVRSIGDLLVALFEGQTGDELKENAAQFCARQQIALEALKERRRKDEHLHKLLAKAESHKACRRLQLKDLLPTVLQRITKYPLLFEKLEKIAKCINPDDEIEIESLHRACDSAKRILIYVNQAVKNAEDAHKLLNIQRKLDKSLFDKDSGNEFKTLDLTQHKLVHDGPLSMKKIPGIQLHGLLFENMMVLLQKQDDKYFIKYFPNLSAGGNESRGISPITNFDQQTLVRQSAVDKNTFFLIITKTSQMLELTAPSSNECKIAKKHPYVKLPDAKLWHVISKMNFLSPDMVSINRRKSLCNGYLLSLENKNSTSEKSSKKREKRRSSFNEALGRKSSLVARWFKHISDAAEQYKPRSKSNHDIVEDPASTVLPHSNTRDSLENTPLKITPHSESDIGAPNEDTLSNVIPESGSDNENLNLNLLSCDKASSGESLSRKNSKNNESINKHISNNNSNANSQNSKSADASDINKTRTECGGAEGAKVNRDTVYSHSSENAKTLMQHCPLLEPSDIQISISPALTAEPIVTPAERLRRLDEAIREDLAEKQRIVCDMFRVPNEHFAAIADIAGQPEAQNDPSEIVLAAFAQVQSLTEILSEYMKVTPGQEISAVSTAVCDQCHYRSLRASSPLPASKNSTNTIQNSSVQSSSKSTTSNDMLLQEDDGYCEIDAVRLPSIKPSQSTMTSAQKQSSGTMITSTPELAKRQIASSMSSVPGDSPQSSTKAGEMSPECKTSENVSISGIPNPKVSGSRDNDGDSRTKILLHAIDNSVLSDRFISRPNDQAFILSADSCGLNRMYHVQSLEPAIPCHVLCGIITALNAQISFLLPKINERDSERDRLRKENQHLRELLNSMHERQRVQDEKETPDITKNENTESEFSPSTLEQEAVSAVIEET